MISELGKERISPGIYPWHATPKDHLTTTFKNPPRLRCYIAKNSTNTRLNANDISADSKASPKPPLVSLAFCELSSKTSRRSWAITSGTDVHVDSAGSTKSSPWNHFTWLVLYFMFNLILTLSNKSVLTGFPFPYTLTALHALCSTIGGLALRWRGFYVTQRLSIRQEIALAAFSFVYGLNVAVSNVSLNLVTVPVSFLDLCSRVHADYFASFIKLFELLRQYLPWHYPHYSSTRDSTIVNLFP
jgi:hypothetical protein